MKTFTITSTIIIERQPGTNITLGFRISLGPLSNLESISENCSPVSPLVQTKNYNITKTRSLSQSSLLIIDTIDTNFYWFSFYIDRFTETDIKIGLLLMLQNWQKSRHRLQNLSSFCASAGGFYSWNVQKHCWLDCNHHWKELSSVLAF